MDNTVHATYRIPSSRVEGLTSVIEKLARRIVKGKTHADFPPAIEATREMIYVRDLNKTRPYNAETVYSPKAEYISYTWVTIKYQRPVINGWTLVAVYDWEVTPDGTQTCYVSTVPGQMVPPELRNPESGQCDHCNTNRRRNKSMLVTKDFLDFKVVGSTCVKDFLGHKSPNSLIDVFSFEMSIREMSEEEPAIGGNPEMALYPSPLILQLSAMFVRMFGYVKTRNDDYATSTASNIHMWLHPYTNEERKFARDNVPTQDDIDVGKHTAEWILRQDNSMDYFDSLQKCVNAGAISHKRVGILASGVSGYQRAVARAMDNATPKANEHLGEIGKRLKDITATVKMVRVVDGYYGETTIITLLTPEGNTLVWFASGSHDVEQGECWVFDGTVKKHDTFNNTNQTVVNRVKYTTTKQEMAA